MKKYTKETISCIIVLIFAVSIIMYAGYTNSSYGDVKISPKKTTQVKEGSGHIEKLEYELSSFTNENYNAGGVVSIYVKRCDTGEVAEYNNQKILAASLIKLYVGACMCENLNSFEPSRKEINNRLSDMISLSDNDACNTLVSYLGYSDTIKGMGVVNAFCQAHKFNNTSMGWLRTAPIEGGDNYTSVEDCANILYEIYNDRIPGSRSIMKYMKAQQRRNKIPSGLPADTVVANKTGELENAECDSAIIYSPKCTYILVVACENVDNSDLAIEFIKNLSSYTYKYFN